MKQSFADKVYIALIEQPYGEPLIPKEENREVTMQLVRQFKSDGLCEKHGFMLECAGNVITKFPTFTLEQVLEWNKSFYSATRQQLRKQINQ